MPRHSPYTIELTAEERAALEARARRYTSPYRDVIRAKIVLLAAEGLGNDRIAARLDTPRQIVSIKTTIGAVDQLVAQVMTTEPYRSARRVFWIADNGSSHRGEKAVARPRAQWPTLTLVHTPVHASWLNQIEIYFSIVQRKVVTPNDFASLTELEDRLLAFQQRYELTATPFHWTFTRTDLADLLAKLKAKELGRAA